jgi:hypothetical protein
MLLVWKYWIIFLTIKWLPWKRRFVRLMSVNQVPFFTIFLVLLINELLIEVVLSKPQVFWRICTSFWPSDTKLLGNQTKKQTFPTILWLRNLPFQTGLKYGYQSSNLSSNWLSSLSGHLGKVLSQAFSGVGGFFKGVWLGGGRECSCGATEARRYPYYHHDSSFSCISTTLSEFTKSFPTYLVPKGSCDIFFPTDFKFLQTMYALITRKKRHEMLVLTNQEFIKRYQDPTKTLTQSGYDPMMQEYVNMNYFLSEWKKEKQIPEMLFFIATWLASHIYAMYTHNNNKYTLLHLYISNRMFRVCVGKQNVGCCSRTTVFKTNNKLGITKKQRYQIMDLILRFRDRGTAKEAATSAGNSVSSTIFVLADHVSLINGRL